jgi:Regulatory subunit of type II PKA R-subunit
VPPHLAEVLKDYTKEVIRRQPENLIEFSAYYFANLANLVPQQDELVAEPPTLVQIKSLFGALTSVACLRTTDVRSLSKQAVIVCAVPDGQRVVLPRAMI